MGTVRSIAVAVALTAGGLVAACGTVLSPSEAPPDQGTDASDAPSLPGAPTADANPNDDANDDASGDAKGGADGGVDATLPACVATACDASCVKRCPRVDSVTPDTVIVASVDKTGTVPHVFLRNEMDCNMYDCVLLVNVDGYACEDPPIGRKGRPCSGGDPCEGAFAVGISKFGGCDEERCTYQCTIVE